MNFISQHLSEIGTFIGGAITGALGGSFLTFKYIGNKISKNSGNIVNQKGAKAGGDVVGRDKIG